MRRAAAHSLVIVATLLKCCPLLACGLCPQVSKEYGEPQLGLIASSTQASRRVCHPHDLAV